MPQDLIRRRGEPIHPDRQVIEKHDRMAAPFGGRSLARRRIFFRRRLVVTGFVVAAVAAGIFFFGRDTVPLEPWQIRGSQAWARKHYGKPGAPRFRAKNVIEINFLGEPMYVHEDAQRHFLRLAHIFQAEAPEYAAQVALSPDDWSYHNRDIRGGDAKSMHAYGIAIDVNALTNVLGTAGDMPEAVVQQWEREGGDWGGDWRRPDPMHFESHLTRREIRERYAPDGTPRDS